MAADSGKGAATAVIAVAVAETQPGTEAATEVATELLRGKSETAPCRQEKMGPNLKKASSKKTIYFLVDRPGLAFAVLLL